jgi:hypothetical protein
MNNDTLIEKNYVETLVRVSRERNAAVGGLIVDSRDPSHILDAGEFVDWKTYSFPVKTAIESGETFLEGVDLLPGRGTLVPIYMIKLSGNINARLFPHYIADYEFFCRLKRRGFRLGVTYEAKVQSHVEATGVYAVSVSSLTFSQAWAALFSTKSMDNVRDHWRFIEQCAPAGMKRKLKWRLAWRSMYLAISKTRMRFVILPLVWFLTGPYYVTRQDCARCGLDVDELVKADILRSWGKEGWYILVNNQEEILQNSEGHRQLCMRASNPLTKIPRWLRAKTCNWSLGRH